MPASELVDHPPGCLWCKAEVCTKPSNVSHVVPASCGNDDIVLPPPIVCTQCNSSFIKIERTFALEPSFNAIASILGVRHGRTGQLFSHDLFEIARKLADPTRTVPRDYSINIEENLIDDEVAPPALEFQGSVSYSDVSVELTKQVTRLTHRWMALYSRAIHKIMFEWYARSYYVKKQFEPGTIDPWDSSYDSLRKFVRYGEPQSDVWPVLRFATGITNEVAFLVTRQGPSVVGEMLLLGLRYVAVLTPGPAEAIVRQLAKNAQARAHLFSTRFEVLDHGQPTISSSFKVE